MAHFYGWMKGARGEVTRCGHKGSGMWATVATYEGAVRVNLYEKDGEDWAHVVLVPHPHDYAHSGRACKTLYDGPVAGWRTV